MKKFLARKAQGNYEIPIMHPVRSLIVYMLFAFGGGALLAPWSYALVQWLAQHSSHVVLQDFADAPFHRVVNRTILILALAGLWPFLRSLGGRSRADLGLVSRGNTLRKILRGFCVGFLSLAIVALIGLFFDVRLLKASDTLYNLFLKMINAALSAIGVAILEEMLFRGALFGALRRAHSWIAAMWISSMVYALLHFLQRVKAPEDIIWSTGFTTLGRMLSGFTQWDLLLPGFFTLTLAGAILAVLYQKSGDLYTSMGLHAGWVFWLKFYGAATSRNPEGAVGTWFFGTKKLYDGWLAMVVLGLVLGGIILAYRHRHRRRRESASVPDKDGPDQVQSENLA